MELSTCPWGQRCQRRSHLKPGIVANEEVGLNLRRLVVQETRKALDLISVAVFDQPL